MNEPSVSLLMKQTRESPKARFMYPRGHSKHRVWLPKSQIDARVTTEADIWNVTMPTWLAERADLMKFVSVNDARYVEDAPQLWTGARKLEFE